MTRGASVALVIAACAHAPAPPAHVVSPIVRADVERAEAAEKARHHDVARAEYERAIADARDPVSVAYARREFAETLGTWGEYEPMIAQLEAAVAARGDDAAAWHDLGLLYFKIRHDATRALAALERAKQLAPGDVRPRRELALVAWCSGDTARAAAEYRALLAFDLPANVRAAVQKALDQLADPSAAPLHCS